MQIGHRTSQASARLASSAMVQGCVNLMGKPTVHEVGRNVARSNKWYERTHGSPDPATRRLCSVSGLEQPLQGRDQVLVNLPRSTPSAR